MKSTFYSMSLSACRMSDCIQYKIQASTSVMRYYDAENRWVDTCETVPKPFFLFRELVGTKDNDPYAVARREWLRRSWTTNTNQKTVFPFVSEWNQKCMNIMEQMKGCFASHSVQNATANLSFKERSTCRYSCENHVADMCNWWNGSKKEMFKK